MPRSYRNSDPTPPIMQGCPVPPEWRVPAHDWDAPPWNRWAFQHMRELVPTVDVPRGPDCWQMPTAPQDVDAIPCIGPDGRASNWADMLDATYTDAALIWLDGRIVTESYWNGMAPRGAHIAFSVSKSVVGATAGTLIADGLMDPAAPVTDLAPELAATAWNGATLGHVLDMTSGTRFDETYGKLDSQVFLLDVAANLKPLYPHMDPDAVPTCTWDLILHETRPAPAEIQRADLPDHRHPGSAGGFRPVQRHAGNRGQAGAPGTGRDADHAVQHAEPLPGDLGAIRTWQQRSADWPPDRRPRLS